MGLAIKCAIDRQFKLVLMQATKITCADKLTVFLKLCTF